MAIDEGGERCVLHLSGIGPGHVDAKKFPNFAQLRARAGEEGPAFEVGLKAARIVLQDRCAVALGIGRNREQEIVLDLVFLEPPLDGGEICREKRAHVGTGRKDKSHENHLSPRGGELKRFAVLVGEFEVRNDGVDDPPADLARFFGWQRNVSEARRRLQYCTERDSEDQPANFRF